jgi:hypothetical protein
MRGRALHSCGSGLGKMMDLHENYDEPWCSIIWCDLLRDFTSTSCSE